MTESQLRYIINEELGIANKVREISNELWTKYRKRELSGTLNCGLDYEIVFDNSINGSIGSYSNEENKIVVKINPYYSENEDIYNSIFHEIEHYWQTKNANKSFGNNATYQMAYKILASDGSINLEKDKTLQIQPDIDFDIRMICKIYYFTRKFEIDAYCNGIYGEFQGKKYYKTINDFMREDCVYGIINEYKTLTTYANNFTTTNKTQNKALNFFVNNIAKLGNKPEKLIKSTTINAYNYLMYKLPRIYTKIINDSK